MNNSPHFLIVSIVDYQNLKLRGKFLLKIQIFEHFHRTVYGLSPNLYAGKK